MRRWSCCRGDPYSCLFFPVFPSCPLLFYRLVGLNNLSSTLFSPVLISLCPFLPFRTILLPEPSQSHRGPEGRGHGAESEPSDDEMLSLSSQQSNTSTAPQKPEPPAAAPAAPGPSEEVDLLGLDGEDISRPSAQPPSAAAAATTTDLLGDLFGGPPQPTSVPSSAQSTPHKVAPSTASPCPSPAPGREYLSCHIKRYVWVIWTRSFMQKRSNNSEGYACVTAAFDPFGAGPMPKPQDVMGSFLGPGNMGQPDPFLHAARSPSPTLQPTSLGKACLCCSAALLHTHSGFWI